LSQRTKNRFALSINKKVADYDDDDDGEESIYSAFENSNDTMSQDD